MALALVWWRGIRLGDAGGGSRRVVRAALLCGVLSGLAALVKPVWILGCLPLAACVLLLRRREGLRAAAAAAAIVIGHAAVVAPWQLFLFEKYGQLGPSRTGAANVNMAAMRYGMTGRRGRHPALRLPAPRRTPRRRARTALGRFRRVRPNQGRHPVVVSQRPRVRARDPSAGRPAARAPAADSRHRLLRRSSAPGRSPAVCGTPRGGPAVLRARLQRRVPDRSRALAAAGHARPLRPRTGGMPRRPARPRGRPRERGDARLLRRRS